MHSSYWRSNVAIGLRTGVVLSAIIYVLGLLAVGPSPRHVRYPSAAKEDQRASKKEAECSNGNQNYPDCIIQLRTAQATERQAEVAWLSMFVSGFALLFAAVAAGAALWTVHTMKDTAKRQLRAYIFVDEAKIIDLSDDTQAKVNVVLKNAGQTPAYAVMHKLGRVTRSVGDTAVFPTLAESDLSGTKTIINPGSAFKMECPLDYSAQQIAAVRNGTEYELFVFALIRYVDAFGGVQTARYRMKLRTEQLAFCEEGNEAT